MLYFDALEVRFCYFFQHGFSDQLSQNFPVHLIPEIIAKIRQSYEENHEYHDPAIGHGPTSYGIHIHETVCYRLMELEEFTDVKVRRKSGSIEIRYGAFVLRPYKLGESEEDDIWLSYPNNVGSAALTRMASNNGTPPLPGLDWSEPTEFTDFVVGHFGAYDEEHSEGCRAIYLCVPKYVEGAFGGWVSCTKIYDASEEEDSYEQGLNELPPIEVTKEPEISFAEEADIEFADEPEIEDIGERENSSSEEEG